MIRVYSAIGGQQERQSAVSSRLSVLGEVAVSRLLLQDGGW